MNETMRREKLLDILYHFAEEQDWTPEGVAIQIEALFEPITKTEDNANRQDWHAIVIDAQDSLKDENPTGDLAVDIESLIAQRDSSFQAGVEAAARLVEELYGEGYLGTPARIRALKRRIKNRNEKSCRRTKGNASPHDGTNS